MHLQIELSQGGDYKMPNGIPDHVGPITKKESDDPILDLVDVDEKEIPLMMEDNGKKIR